MDAHIFIVLIVIGILVYYLAGKWADSISEGIKEKYSYPKLKISSTEVLKKTLDIQQELMKPRICPDCGESMVYKNSASHCYPCDYHVNSDSLKLDEFSKNIDLYADTETAKYIMENNNARIR